ncbi:hypothetical protein GUITHDRAFT_112743 [Guillardia theta CCMP2712]|uniref:Glutathione S-transferase n=2 Tax=Guillardia theta TaxID=55529 RepID=L1IYI7_GUITC|nr:hypothetical protein GUITHDRAFT_112743 [Guillardia theta CCMP2712]EKX41281.1 hypothetical protein GUITHDRAFT_112743 [Guillardia theta CCMP2712]|eukprot:XP_005828261.1 hypothetical protein GUITHDRAFT_112743 [Guillardia theta CCMP2712]
MAMKLVYFDLRGKAEVLRLMLHVAGQEFDDCPGGVNKADWDSQLLFGQLPLLIDGDRKIVQSGAIARYLASKLNLCGSTEDDKLLCDQLYEGAEDVFQALWPACTKYRGGSPEALEKVLAEGGNVHKYLTRFNAILEGKKFFLGETFSYADLALYNVLTLSSAIDVNNYIAPNFPNIKKHFDAVEAHPKIDAYNKSGKRRPPFEPFTF